jgi:hypothetical protein
MFLSTLGLKICFERSVFAVAEFKTAGASGIDGYSGAFEVRVESCRQEDSQSVRRSRRC